MHAPQSAKLVLDSEPSVSDTKACERQVCILTHRELEDPRRGDLLKLEYPSCDAHAPGMVTLKLTAHAHYALMGKGDEVLRRVCSDCYPVAVDLP